MRADLHDLVTVVDLELGLLLLPRERPGEAVDRDLVPQAVVDVPLPQHRVLHGAHERVLGVLERGGAIGQRQVEDRVPGLHEVATKR